MRERRCRPTLKRGGGGAVLKKRGGRSHDPAAPAPTQARRRRCAGRRCRSDDRQAARARKSRSRSRAAEVLHRSRLRRVGLRIEGRARLDVDEQAADPTPSELVRQHQAAGTASGNEDFCLHGAFSTIGANPCQAGHVATRPSRSVFSAFLRRGSNASFSLSSPSCSRHSRCTTIVALIPALGATTLERRVRVGCPPAAPACRRRLLE